MPPRIYSGVRVSLEFSKLSAQVEAMGSVVARRQREHVDQVTAARASLARHAPVTEELKGKIRTARREDTSWRGAEPVGDRLDVRHVPGTAPQSATLIAADGSQIYPNRHGIATYYLVNTGSIVLRQGSSQAPDTDSRPVIFFEEDELYDDAGRLRDPEYINSQRDRSELAALADLTEAERVVLGGDADRPLVALVDGPLLHWTPQRSTDREMSREVRRFTWQLARLKRAQAIPLGYVDRPNSANVLRTLDVADIAEEEITRDRVRHGEYRRLTDRLLFADLAPNQRSALFASTSELNDCYTGLGHRIVFFYLNVARRGGPANAIIARIELPEWAADDHIALDVAQQAVYADCALTGYPYVLARAHELAVVSNAERSELEKALGQAMLRHGVLPAESTKAGLKQLLGSRRGGKRRSYG
jgi:hypothetical protein